MRSTRRSAEGRVDGAYLREPVHRSPTGHETEHSRKPVGVYGGEESDVATVAQTGHLLTYANDVRRAQSPGPFPFNASRRIHRSTYRVMALSGDCLFLFVVVTSAEQTL